jgi:hypothetical protein
MTTSSDERPALRIGNAEREAAYAALSTHLDAGRLDPDEYGERYARASLARTRPELEALFVDLPLPHPRFEAAAPPVSTAPSWASGRPDWTARRRPSGWRLYPALFAAVPLIAIVVAASTGFWFIFVLIPIAASFLGRRFGRRGYGHHGGYRGSYGHHGGYGRR